MKHKTYSTLGTFGLFSKENYVELWLVTYFFFCIFVVLSMAKRCKVQKGLLGTLCLLGYINK